VKSFDHVGVDAWVVSCDMRDVSSYVKDGELDVVTLLPFANG
jgi:hypothetical protein